MDNEELQSLLNSSTANQNQLQHKVMSQNLGTLQFPPPENNYVVFTRAQLKLTTERGVGGGSGSYHYLSRVRNKVANWSGFDYSQDHCASFVGKGLYCSIASLPQAKNGHLKTGHCTINTISSRQVMRIKKNIN